MRKPELAEDPPRPDDTACEALLRAYMLDCAATFSSELGRLMASDDPRGPHRARVALRKLTTALDLFAPLMRRKRRARLRGQAKALFRLLGPLRDSDVHTAARQNAPGHKERLRRNTAVRKQVRKELEAADAEAFAARLADVAAPDGALWRRGAEARALRAAPLAQVGAGMLETAWAACRAHGSSVSAMDPVARHEFRKDLKSMRYLAEFLAPWFPGLAQDPFGSDFRDIQDALGVLNDYQVALALEGRKPPPVLPAAQTRALVAAETIWLRLQSAPVPWGPAVPA